MTSTDERCYLVVPLLVEGATPDHYAILERPQNPEAEPRFIRVTKTLELYPERLIVQSEPLHVGLDALIRMMTIGL